jgi:uncharacterized protein (DUF983 family)
VSDTPEEEISIARAAFGCLCPRCGSRGIFKGLIAVNFRCKACGLDLTKCDIGDGPALAVTIGLSVFFATIALIVEWYIELDYWVHILLWPGLVIGLSILTIRPIKAGLIAIGYWYHAGKITL